VTGVNRETIFGGNPLAVLLRLVVISVVVGIVLSALDIAPRDLFFRLNILARRIYDMGFGVIENGLQYFLVGAVIVFPIWIIARLMGLIGGKHKAPQD
jgi:hypothetical protein